ncbi:transmembrane protein 254-like isoform X2 [Branchiostoma lanceolatum]|uniref:transmembrane protein 254-like isoform X2 n=1 Tax=Branchiostoma lanceolatum TaxID=7740 RepID=UPI003456971A
MAAPKENFKRVPFWAMGIVFSLFLVTGLALFAPDATPWYVMGPVGSFVQKTIKTDPERVQQLPLRILGMHTLETVIAFFITLYKGISGAARQKWLLQTLVFGVFSLVPLVMFTPAKDRKIK